MNNILNSEQIEKIIKCGKILRDSMEVVKEAVKPGISTYTLDQIAESEFKKRNATASFKNYKVGDKRFPNSICISINDEVVHGIPHKDRILKDGDIVSLDLGAQYKGLYTDMAVTVAVGSISLDKQKLIDVTHECLNKGILAVKVGKSIGDIGHSIQTCAEKEGLGVIRNLVGHGIGAKPHTSPQIPNFGKPSSGLRIEEDMALAIEPMLTAGDYNIEIKDDGWTVTTKDRSLSAHFEHTVVIINGKPTVITN